MRILSISGQNIASLAAPFEIDFTAEPLHSAGLFAITGETGVGKSSILDAMCLALYGEAPRLTLGGSKDDVPDVGADTIKAQDARSILRRGAAQGWAAVSFVGLDGVAYKAVWTARRARDRATGKLQAVQRSLSRIADGHVLASQITAVSEQVQMLSGLSYDEFRRTVLLAQGDFDAFLRAETNDRAALLEKVTGTKLYRDISARIFQRTEAVRGVYDGLILRRGEHRLLTDEDRAALEAERETLATQSDAAHALRKAHTADLDRHARHANAKAKLLAAQTAETQALAAQAGAAADRDLLHRIEAAEPLRLPWENVKAAEEARTNAEAALADAITALTAAEATTAERQAAATRAQQAQAEREQEFKTFGPLWTRAAQLDTQILSARQEAANASDTAKTATSEAATARQNAVDLLSAHAKAGQSQQEASNLLATLGAIAPLADQRDQLIRDLSARDTADKAHADATARARALAQKATVLAAEISQCDAADNKDRDQRDSLTTQIAKQASQIATIEASAPQERVETCSSLIAALTALDAAQQNHLAGQNRIDRAQTAHAKATSDAEAAALARAAALEAETRADATLQALAAPMERADLAVTEVARQMRLRLEAGTPCPVCGATDHPTASDAAIASLAAQLRSDQDVARVNAKAARDSVKEADTNATLARVQREQAETEIATGIKDLHRAATAWQQAFDQATATEICPPLPATPQAPTPSVAVAIAQGETMRLAAREETRSLSALRKSHSETMQQRDALTLAMEQRTQAKAALREDIGKTAQEQALADQTASHQRQRKEALDATLLPLLERLAESASALDDIAGLQQRIEEKLDTFTTAREALTAADTRLAELTPRLATAQSRAEQATDRADQAAQMATSRRNALCDLTEQRARLLGGEPTETHRTRINTARLDAHTLAEATARTLAEASTRTGTALGQKSAALAALDKASANVSHRQNALNAALIESELTAQSLGALLGRKRTEVEGIRRALRQYDEAATAAKATKSARQTDVSLAAQDLPEADVETLTDALNSLDLAQSARQERIGAITGQLGADAEARKALQGLEAEIVTAKADLEVWQAVNAAVGSRSGDKFARTAQSITLDVLVDRANHHLADLKPRYRLRRATDLALHIADRDMGGETRATRSLSGGERFLVSLALALALSRMGGKGGLAATLFIDEGFGSLDAESLDLAIDALETLQSQGRSVGVISHVEAMKDRIPVQIRVKRQGNGKSSVQVVAPK
ncbi:AAA family ATPase [Pseudorhodobacter aquimaris]|uniref:AAA family ATPase n=1 Tax=Pseudorhodobacter aquimaris TaxID=687412 RepID=UPI00067C866D|nr:AAA family ATPase [Pseudorhodobacter aquimaris]